MTSYVYDLIHDDFGALVGHCLSILTVAALATCFLKRLLKRYYGNEIFLGERERSARARQRLKQVAGDAAFATLLERELEEGKRREMIEQKRKARRAEAKKMLEGVTMTVEVQDISVTLDLDTFVPELKVRLPAAASTEVGIGRLEPAYCAACLADFELRDALVWSPNARCKHVFHDDCILTWLSRGKRHCPCCREPFLDPPKEMVEDIAENESEEDYLEERRSAVATEDDIKFHRRRYGSIPMQHTNPSNNPTKAESDFYAKDWGLPPGFFDMNNDTDSDSEGSVRSGVSGTNEVAAVSSLDSEKSSKDSKKPLE